MRYFWRFQLTQPFGICRKSGDFDELIQSDYFINVQTFKCHFWPLIIFLCVSSVRKFGPYTQFKWNLLFLSTDKHLVFPLHLRLNWTCNFFRRVFFGFFIQINCIHGIRCLEFQICPSRTGPLWHYYRNKCMQQCIWKKLYTVMYLVMLRTVIQYEIVLMIIIVQTQSNVNATNLEMCITLNQYLCLFIRSAPRLVSHIKYDKYIKMFIVIESLRQQSFEFEFSHFWIYYGNVCCFR